MLYPSDPSCSSSKVSALRSDEKFSEPDPVAVSLGEAHTPNFSIRDYVFASRSKNSGTSWPFPRWLLEFCLKHGVKDLLPPFEPPSSVRSSSAEKIKVNSPQVFGETFLLDGQHNLTRTSSCLPSDHDIFPRRLNKGEEGRCSSDQEDKSDSLINDVCELGSTVTIQRDIKRISGEPAAKKRRLILPGVISETSQAEEIASSSIASDPMASKVCPVCKTFSSTSNTTLNAHMDQCLSMASDATMNVDEIPKLKVKPRKKRLMEDIYATASHCSLEDLDRRNGTSWASTLNLAPSPNDANAEAKKLELPPMDNRDGRSEGDVYVDSNGIKLRILSKFNNTCQVMPKEVLFRPRKNFKHVRDKKIILICKKKHFGEQHTKKLKLRMKNKKLRSLKLFKNETTSEASQHEEAHQDDGSAQLSGDLGQAQGNLGTATLQRWPSSKRSDLAKKNCKKDFIRSLDQSELVTQMKMLDTRNSDSSTYSSAKWHRKLSQSLESKIANFTPNTHQNKENEEKNSHGCLSETISTKIICRKLSRAVPRTRNNEFCLGKKHKLFDPPLKTVRISTLTGSNSSSKKIGKHRSVLHFPKRKRDIPLNSNGDQQTCTDAAISGFLDEHITDQCVHLGRGQCQDAQPMCSKWLSINRNSSFDNIYDSSITAKSLNVEGTGLLISSDDKISRAIPMKAYGMTMEQLLLDKHDKIIPDKLESRGVESEAGAASTESSACLTSHGDLEPDIQRENCSIASAPVNPCQISYLTINREPFGSPLNSFISSGSLKDSHSKASDRELGRFITRNPHFQMDSTMEKPWQQSGYHHCCCSWQSLIPGTIPTSKQKNFPNLSIKPSILSSFGPYSSLRTEIAAASLDSPTCSMVTRACNTIVDSTSPSCGTPSQPSSNSILRLMGKDLMVSHNEEPSNLPKFDSPVKDNNPTVQSLPSPLSFTPCASVPSHVSFPFTLHSPAPPMTNTQFHGHSQSVHQSNMNHNAYVTKNAIAIDGPSNDDMMIRGSLLPRPTSRAMFQRFSPYFGPHNQLLPNENDYAINDGSSVEIPAPLLPRPFMFASPSANHCNPPFCYPQSLR